MISDEDKKGVPAPGDGAAPVPVLPEQAPLTLVPGSAPTLVPEVAGGLAGTSEAGHPSDSSEEPHSIDYRHGSRGVEHQAGSPIPSYSLTADDSYGPYDDPYAYNPNAGTALTTTPPATLTAPAPPANPPTPPVDSGDEDDPEEPGMLRMSFLGHLEELRTRLIYMIGGLVVAFVACLTFCDRLWVVIQEPAISAMLQLGIKDPHLVVTEPMEAFQIIWVKLPLLCSVFIASPWILYQIWAFIAPGLYKKERRLAVPFVLCSAGLFITGGLFAYFIAFRYALAFLLGIGYNIHVQPLISIQHYFDLFVDVILGIGLVFEMPVIIVFLTLLRLASPSFLLSHSRYAILIITIIAAVVTPTPDAFNMMLFAVPMVFLYFIGVFVSYVLVLKRENRNFPWPAFFKVMGAIVVTIAIVAYVLLVTYHFRLVLSWPFLVR